MARKSCFISVLLLLIVFFFSACEGDLSSLDEDAYGSLDTAAVAVSVDWPEDEGETDNAVAYDNDPSRPKMMASSMKLSDDCESRGVDTVRVGVQNSSGVALKSAEFDCSAGQGKLTGIKPQHDCTIVVSGLGSGGNAIYKGSKTNVTLYAGMNDVGEIQVKPLWFLKNTTEDGNGIVSMTTIRNRLEYAYKTINWDGLSNIRISLDLRATTEVSYAEYNVLYILPASWLATGNRNGEPIHRFLQVGYADGGSSRKWHTDLNDELVGFNPIVGAWYRYTWEYDYGSRTLVLKVVDQNQNNIINHVFKNFEFGFLSSDRIIGFFSGKMNADYGNPSQTIEIKSLNVLLDP